MGTMLNKKCSLWASVLVESPSGRMNPQRGSASSERRCCCNAKTYSRVANFDADPGGRQEWSLCWKPTKGCDNEFHDPQVLRRGSDYCGLRRAKSSG